MEAEVAIVGAGVVGCASAMALARRGVEVAVLEADAEAGLAASGTNSGILHTGFDSAPGELETEMILRSAALRGEVLDRLAVPLISCDALMRPLVDGDDGRIADLAANAERNGVEVGRRDDGGLEVPGESVTDPVAYTLALAAAAERHGAAISTGFRVTRLDRTASGLRLRSDDGAAVDCAVAVNCAGLGAGRVARLAGDKSFDVYPRKGEFLVFDPPGGQPLEQILLPVPSQGTKGVLVFPTVDGRVVAGPTAVDQEDEDDWSVRAEAADEILPKAIAMHPPLAGLDPIASYAGLRPAGRDGTNYVIGRSEACPELVNAGAIRSTGLTASLGIAERVTELVGEAGVALGSEVELEPGEASSVSGPWWRRTAEARA